MEEPKSKEYREYVDRHNYHNPHEIMVEITLAEYRELVETAAMYKQSLRVKLSATE